MSKFHIPETKVISASAGGGLGAAVGSFALWGLGVTVWHAPNSASQAASAVGAVPGPVSDLVLVVLAVLGAFASGYVAPHTVRPPEQATPAAVQAGTVTTSNAPGQPAATQSPADSPSGELPGSLPTTHAVSSTESISAMFTAPPKPKHRTGTTSTAVTGAKPLPYHQNPDDSIPEQSGDDPPAFPIGNPQNYDGPSETS